MILPPPTDPMAVARLFAEAEYTREGDLTLRTWRGANWKWTGPHWVEVDPAAVRRDAYAFTERATYPFGHLEARWAPTRTKIANLIEALQAITHLDSAVDQPTWISPETHPKTTVATASGLLDLEGRVLLPHTPQFFNQTSVAFAYEPSAQVPERWLRFLDQLWPDDAESIRALQEWFGYVVSGRTNLQKILLLIGPSRAGKGTIARVLSNLVGIRNVAGPTLSSFSSDFGLAPLLGKPLAIVSDARLDATRDTSTVVERLLAISGEDRITINRKYSQQVTVKLPTRFMIVSNELPKLGDASGTVAGRFVVLELKRSWLGNEDLTLEDALLAESPGIFNWALDGLDRLLEQGRFTRPSATDEAFVALQDLASPVAAFVREECVVGPHTVAVEAIFAQWRDWATDTGNRVGSAQTFARNLRAVIPGLRTTRPRDGDRRSRYFQGIGLRHSATADAADHRGPGSEEQTGFGPRWSATHVTVT